MVSSVHNATQTITAVPTVLDNRVIFALGRLMLLHLLHYLSTTTRSDGSNSSEGISIALRYDGISYYSFGAGGEYYRAAFNTWQDTFPSRLIRIKKMCITNAGECTHDKRVKSVGLIFRHR